MASPSKQLLLIAFLIMLSNDISLGSSESTPEFRFCSWTKKHVFIKNEVGQNEILGVHCQSKDDNLGVHLLNNEDTYEFHFRDAFFGTTKFTCDLSYGRKHAKIEAYNQNRDCVKGRIHKRARWTATRDAILGYSDNKKPPKQQDITVQWQE